MAGNAFPNQLAAQHWLIRSAILCAGVWERVSFWQQHMFTKHLLGNMLPPDAGGDLMLRKDGTKEEEVTPGPGGITEPY